MHPTIGPVARPPLSLPFPPLPPLPSPSLSIPSPLCLMGPHLDLVVQLPGEALGDPPQLNPLLRALRGQSVLTVCLLEGGGICACVCVCVCACVCVCVHVCVYMCGAHIKTCTYQTHVYTAINTHTHTHVCTHIPITTGTCTYVIMNIVPVQTLRTHTCTHTCTHICQHTCTYAHMHTCTYAHIHTCTYARMHTCTYAHMHICTHAHMHICTHAHMHTCTHAHMHTCTYMYPHTRRRQCKGFIANKRTPPTTMTPINPTFLAHSSQSMHDLPGAGTQALIQYDMQKAFANSPFLPSSSGHAKPQHDDNTTV